MCLTRNSWKTLFGDLRGQDEESTDASPIVWTAPMWPKVKQLGGFLFQEGHLPLVSCNIIQGFIAYTMGS